MKKRFEFIIKTIISPRSLMRDLSQRPQLWILLIYPLMATLIVVPTPPQARQGFSILAAVISIIFLSMLYGVHALTFAGILYVISKYYKGRNMVTSYVTFLSGIAFAEVPTLFEHLVRTLFPYLNKSTAAGKVYFLLSIATLIDKDLGMRMPLLFNVAAYVLEPFKLWTFLLWIFLISEFNKFTIRKSVCIALILLLLYPVLLWIKTG